MSYVVVFSTAPGFQRAFSFHPFHREEHLYVDMAFFMSVCFCSFSFFVETRTSPDNTDGRVDTYQKFSGSMFCPSSSQAIGEGSHQGAIPTSPLSVLHTQSCMQCTVVNLCASKRDDLDGQIDCLFSICIDRSIVQQTVGAGRRRLPQHPLHNARDITVIIPRFQIFIFLHSREKCINPWVIFLHSYTYPVDCLHHRALFLVSEPIHVLLAIADGRLGVTPHACLKPLSNQGFQLHSLCLQSSRRFCP